MLVAFLPSSSSSRQIISKVLFPHHFTLQEAEGRVWQAGGSLEKAWRRSRVRGDRGGRGGGRLQRGERPGGGSGAGHRAGGGDFCAQRLQLAVRPDQLQAAGSLAPAWQGGRGTNTPLTFLNEHPLLKLISLIRLESDGISDSLGNSPVCYCQLEGAPSLSHLYIHAKDCKPNRVCLAFIPLFGEVKYLGISRHIAMHWLAAGLWLPLRLWWFCTADSFLWFPNIVFPFVVFSV